MSTPIVETWSGADLSQLGPVYPGVGWEVTLFVVGVAFWLLFHILQARIEKKEFEVDEAAARSKERLERVFDEEARE